MTSIINKTTIIYDSILINEIVKFKEQYVIKYELRRYNTASYIESSQSYIRDKMYSELLPKINFINKSKKKTHNNIYALFILLLLENPHQFSNWEEVSDEFYGFKEVDECVFKNEKYTITNDFYMDISNNYETCQCACGKEGCSPHRVGIIGNDEGAFLFGSVCIDKVGIKFTSHCDKTKRKKDKAEQEKQDMTNKAIRRTIGFGMYKGECTYEELGNRNPEYLKYMKDEKKWFDNDRFPYNSCMREWIDSL